MTKSGESATYTAPGLAPASDTTITITATSVSDNKRSGATRITFAAIAISLDPPEAVVDAGTTQTMTASVGNDSAQAGVTWAMKPASGAGTLNNPTSTTVTYVAPADPPPQDVDVTITATSVTDLSRSASAHITFPAMTLIVDPASMSLDAGGSKVFRASIRHAPATVAANVTWSIQPETGAGGLSDATAKSVKYSAEETPPADDTEATITATSIIPAGLSASANVTVNAIKVSTSPDSALVPIGTRQPFHAVVSHDPADQGVSWQLLQDGNTCDPGCGTITSSDESLAGYQAPSAPTPASPVVLRATSRTDTSKTFDSTIAVSAGVLSVVPTALDFGSVKILYGMKRLNTTITNTGNREVKIASVKVIGPDASHFKPLYDCGSSIAAQASCTIPVEFTTSMTTKARATLTIADDDLNSPQLVALSGRGFGYYAVPASVSQAEHLRVPSPTGSLKVGTRVVRLTDGARPDPLLADGTRRFVALRFWYPAAADAACRNAPYMSPAVWSYFARLAGTRLPAILTNSCMDAPVADGTYPVVVFSHGLTGTFTDYTYLFEELASRGYVVAAVDHTHEATAVELADGHIAGSRYGSYLTHIAQLDAASARQLEMTRLGDMQFVIDEVERLQNQPGNPWLPITCV